MKQLNNSLSLSNGGQLLITGGAGFVGSNLAISFKSKYPELEVVTLDNLKRRGSELNIKRLKEYGIQFIHGDIRNQEDLLFNDRKIALIIECSAEPSVLAGFGNSAGYLLNSNLFGAINCLELARRHAADFIFLSTSRVYPINKINNLRYRENNARFSLLENQIIHGACRKGISENFPLEGSRSLYGATKLASEIIACEYAEMYGIKIVINRCGVIAGPWQMGKVDQGFLTLWMAAHYFKRVLKYIGFDGKGKQVRDVLHVDDLFNLVDFQIRNIDKFNKQTYNVGGGLTNSLSLLETTQHCEEISGNKISIERQFKNRLGDIKFYVSDCSKILEEANWKPKKTARQTLEDIWNWIHDNELELKHIFE